MTDGDKYGLVDLGTRNLQVLDSEIRYLLPQFFEIGLRFFTMRAAISPNQISVNRPFLMRRGATGCKDLKCGDK
jgi:hypothetical protein